MDGNQKNIVIGTAGHVDHGKTMLVKALTGIDTDRLKEEKERGMTIEPGFANLRLPSGKVVSVVDVPGHERFIKNMLKGVSGIDIAMLVVAADDGVMPQTREHFDILRLLNIQHGLIVISKVDLVDEELFHMAEEEVRSLVNETFLENAPIISFSAKTGQGKKEILRSVDDLSLQVVEKNQKGIFRLPVDRVFTMAGYGTIVTGTVASGKIKTGDFVEIYPVGKTTSVRNIQIHNQWVGEAIAGHRVGLNLSNIKVEQLARGMVLGEPQSMISSHLVNAHFQYLPSNPNPLNNRTKVKFYSGTSEVIARVILIEKDELNPGESCFVQFRLEGKTTLLAYDKYIIRTLSPMKTIGGGTILEIDPKKYRPVHFYGLVDQLYALERRNINDMLESSIRKERFKPVNILELAKKFCLSKAEIDGAFDYLLKEGTVLSIGENSVIHKESHTYIKTAILEQLKDFHTSNKHIKDVSQEYIRSKISPMLNQRLYELIIQELKDEGKIEINQGRVWLSGFKIRLGEKEKRIYDYLDKTCRDYHFRPLPLNVFAKIKERFGQKDVEDVMKAMIGEGRLVKLNNNRLIHIYAIDEVKRKVIEHVDKRGQVAIAEFVEVIGLGRTQIQPIFDYLDAIRFTMRIGDYRVLYKGINKDADNNICGTKTP